MRQEGVTKRYSVVEKSYKSGQASMTSTANAFVDASPQLYHWQASAVSPLLRLGRTSRVIWIQWTPVLSVLFILETGRRGKIPEVHTWPYSQGRIVIEKANCSCRWLYCLSFFPRQLCLMLPCSEKLILQYYDHPIVGSINFYVCCRSCRRTRSL